MGLWCPDLTLSHPVKTFALYSPTFQKNSLCHGENIALLIYYSHFEVVLTFLLNSTDGLTSALETQIKSKDLEARGHLV